MKVMVGGIFGKSGGKTNRALKKPPSKRVPSGPMIKISHSYRLLSSAKPTDTKSMGFLHKSVFRFVQSKVRNNGGKKFGGIDCYTGDEQWKLARNDEPYECQSISSSNAT